MWDIKLRDWEENAIAAEYYLNHVGYKGTTQQGCKHQVKAYYLNHVGYKVFEGSSKTRTRYMYYLNHVGYKDKITHF